VLCPECRDQITLDLAGWQPPVAGRNNAEQTASGESQPLQVASQGRANDILGDDSLPSANVTY
jgi:hypothetical protein